MSTNISHEELVRQLSKPGLHILKSLSPEKCHLLHMAVGISTEAGELLDQVKKHVIYDKDLDIDNLIEELGDLRFYMEGVLQSINRLTGIGLEDRNILTFNIEKLSKRYESLSYTNEAAIERKDKQ